MYFDTELRQISILFQQWSYYNERLVNSFILHDQSENRTDIGRFRNKPYGIPLRFRLTKGTRKSIFLESLPKRSHTKISDTCSMHCNNLTVHMYYSMSLCLCMYANHYQSSARGMH